MDRRQFVSLAVAGAAAPLTDLNGWRLRTGAAGNIVSLRRGEVELADPGQQQNAPRVSGPARLRSRAELKSLSGGAVALVQTVELEPGSGSGPVHVEVPRALRLPGEVRSFALAKNGVARRAPGRMVCGYQFAGSHGVDSALNLAVPMVSESNGSLRITVVTDPAFSAGFSDTVSWTYADAVPLGKGERRTVWTIISAGDERSAMDAFYSTALAAVSPGPAWLHDVAMVGYDFLSRNGRGWFADIDALERLIEPRDRSKVVLALHGWYDYCGRYAFDAKTGRLERTWTAFPNADGEEMKRRATKTDFSNPFHWAAERVRAVRPVEMSLTSMHQRIRYAKSRGFRVALYFADGMNSCDGIPGFDPSRVLRWGGWAGPETRGRSYAMNPVHPDVRRFFFAYIDALLREYGQEIDALVWDETFMVQGGDLGTEQVRGYSGREMMRLVGELAAKSAAHRKDLAFLASDDVGVARGYEAPYALMAHGTYQDSSCAPKGWPYALAPNFRNTLWGCNWAPMRAFDRSEYAVNTFDVPLPVSNGYGEDVGIAEMAPDDVKRMMALFNQRKQRRMDITWIEDQNGQLTYRGRPVRAV